MVGRDFGLLKSGTLFLFLIGVCFQFLLPFELLLSSFERLGCACTVLSWQRCLAFGCSIRC